MLIPFQRNQWPTCPRLFYVRPALVCLALATLFGPIAASSQEGNADDPFVSVTAGLAGCPEARRPVNTDDSRSQAHWRSQRGGSCYLAGRCRLPSAYLYDKEIVPRVVIAANSDGQFSNTTVWVLGSRRWIWLKGCVSSPEQRALLEERVRNIDDVEHVINELMIGKTGVPPYEVQGVEQH